MEKSTAQDNQKPPAGRPPKLLERLRDKLRVKRYSIRTEQSYIDWSRRFMLGQSGDILLFRPQVNLGSRLAHAALRRFAA